MKVLAGRYSIEEPIGQGRSTVYRGTDTRLHRTVALKEVQLNAGDESLDRVRHRALREARAAARLHDPSVVTVFDVVEEGGSIWLVMELVDAPSLADVVRDGGPLDHAQAAWVGSAVLDALVAAHEVGVVHRDVKPANVLVRSEDDRVKLADFGVATLHDETRVTATGLAVGSPAYMAPEQARGEDAGPPADLWALGATLYFAYEGVPPFNGGSVIATATAVVHDEPRPEQRPGPLSRLVHRLLVKDPAQRPDAAEVRRVLRHIAEGTAPPVPTAAAATTQVSAPTSVTRTIKPPTPARQPGGFQPTRRHAAVLLAAVVALLAVVVAPRLFAGDDDDGDDDPTDQAATPTTDATSPTTEAEETDEATTTTEAATTTSAPADDAAAVPDGWETYTDANAGYTISVPAGWEIRPGNPRTDLVDPATGTFLRVDWTATPRPDPVADWRQQAERFASSHEGYEEISIASYEYRDYTAALWEFRYTEGGTRYHAGNLGFVANGRGYALYFHTTDDRWAAGQPTFTQLRESFSPAAP